MHHQPPWPQPAWATDIEGLNKGNAPLGPHNGAFGPVSSTYDLAGLAADFIASLLEQGSRGQAAKQILVDMRATCGGNDMTRTAAANNMGLGPSKFPSSTYNGMLEYVNAKRVWQDGRYRIWPWPFDASGLKPDYVVSETAPDPGGLDAQEFYRVTKEVGDNARVGGKSQLSDVYKGFADTVKDKLGTYEGKNVLVVVDLTDNVELLGLDPGEAELRLGEALTKVPESTLTRLIVAIAILPDSILYLHRR